MSTYLLSLSDTRAALASVGGKGLSLAKLAQAGFPIPKGFHITTNAYRAFIEANGLQPRLLPRARLDELGLEPAALGPAQVHPDEHLGPVLRVGPAFAGVDGDERVAGVVLAREERILAQAVELALDRPKVLVQLAGEVAVEGEQLPGVLEVANEPLVALEAPGQACVLGGDVGRAPLVVSQ